MSWRSTVSLVRFAAVERAVDEMLKSVVVYVKWETGARIDAV